MATYKIQHRRSTAAVAAASNPVLAMGEPGMETDTGKTKLGDGVTAWNALPYDAPNATVLGSTYARIIQAVVGESATATVTRVNAALAATSAFGIATTVRLEGDFTINAPLVVKSNTTVDASAATVTLTANSLCNALQNTAVNGTRRVIDAVTTAASTTLTSATAAFTAGDTGKTVTIWNAGVGGSKLVTTMTYVNATTATLAVAATTAHTAQYLSIGARDRNIRVTGGKWVRELGNYTAGLNGWNSNNVRLRHIDDLEVDHLTVNIVSGKYAVNIGDCTGYDIHHIKADSTSSDVVHINGPASNGHVGTITSDGSGDDIVSITGGDFYTVHQMADCQGDVTDLTIETIKTARSTHVSDYSRAVLLLAGQSLDASIGYTVARVTVRDVKSRLSVPSAPVWVGGDPGDNNTQGGTYSDILIDGVVNAPNAGAPIPGACVRLRDGAMSNIEVRSLNNIGGTYDLTVEAGATVTGLRASGTPSSRINNLSARSPVPPSGVDALTLGESTLPRTSVVFGTAALNTGALPSGRMSGAAFTATKSETITKVRAYTSTTAAAATPTLCRIGVYTVAADGALTALVASTPNDTTLWAAASTAYTRTFTAPFAKVAGQRYAVVILTVSAAAMPTFVGLPGNTELYLPPMIGVRLDGQADLPASATFASLSGAPHATYAVLMP